MKKKQEYFEKRLSAESLKIPITEVTRSKAISWLFNQYTKNEEQIISEVESDSKI